MANLLSQDTQKTLFARMVRRTSVVGTGLLALVALVGVTALVPGYLLLDAEREAIEYELSILEESAKTHPDRTTVSGVNKRLRILAGITERPARLPEAIKRVVEERVGGMSIERIAYDSGFGAGTTTQPVLSVSATMQSRADGTVYLGRLKNDELFKSAEIPLSSFTLRDENAVNFLVHGPF